MSSGARRRRGGGSFWRCTAGECGGNGVAGEGPQARNGAVAVGKGSRRRRPPLLGSGGSINSTVGDEEDEEVCVLLKTLLKGG